MAAVKGMIAKTAGPHGHEHVRIGGGFRGIVSCCTLVALAGRFTLCSDAPFRNTPVVASSGMAFTVAMPETASTSHPPLGSTAMVMGMSAEMTCELFSNVSSPVDEVTL